jgi:SAM-dependent methyltransferase
MQCRICATEIVNPVYREKTLKFAEFSGGLNPEKQVFLCPVCGHASSPPIAEIGEFYDTGYQFQLGDEDEDQLYEMRDGKPFFRNARQAELVLEHCPPPDGARVLDYGAAKAVTLANLKRARPDIVPAVFDVSEMYVPLWDKWIAKEDQAAYRCPETWNGRFDLITAHFVLEHVEEPVAILKDIARQLTPDGRAFISFPNLLTNQGDVLVVEHLSHFTRPSLERAMSEAGLVPEQILEDAYRGAFVVIARTGESTLPGPEPVARAVAEITAIAEFWTEARRRLEIASAQYGDRPAAIYGAGFYGVFIADVLEGRQKVVGHFDRNPFVRANAPVSPVFDPLEPPNEIEVVYSGVNPVIAQRVMEEWQADLGRRFEIVYLAGDGA